MSAIAKDPVCGMDVEIATAEWTYDYEGETYYFCAPGCRLSFSRDPEKYLQGGTEAHSDHSAHPQH